MVGTSTAEVASAPDRTTAISDAARVELFRALGDQTRLAVLDLLATAGSRCHCELEVELAVPANRLSFHLKVLRDAGLVGTTRHGRRSHYHLEPGALERVHTALPTPTAGREGLAAGASCATGLEASR